jgi:hypothetical protein
MSAYDIGAKGGAVNIKRDLVNYQDGVYSAHFSGPSVTFTDSTGGLGTGDISDLTFGADDALLNLDCGSSAVALNYVYVNINVDYMLWDANTISCGSVSFPSSGSYPVLTVEEAPGGTPDTGSWVIIDTQSTTSPTSDYRSINFPSGVTRSWSGGELFLNHS